MPTHFLIRINYAFLLTTFKIVYAFWLGKNAVLNGKKSRLLSFFQRFLILRLHKGVWFQPNWLKFSGLETISTPRRVHSRDKFYKIKRPVRLLCRRRELSAIKASWGFRSVWRDQAASSHLRGIPFAFCIFP